MRNFRHGRRANHPFDEGCGERPGYANSPGMKNRTSFLHLVTIVAAIAAGCADLATTGGDQGVCIPTTTLACVCNDGMPGAQICQDSGAAFGPCDCAGAEDVAGDETSPGDAAVMDVPVEPDLGPDEDVFVEPLCDDDCDDGLPCTTDLCLPDATCLHEVKASFCVVEGACITEGLFNPGNACEICDPAAFIDAWTSRNLAVCEDGDVCTGLGICNKNVCEPGEPLDCDDDVFCNGLETCDPDLGGCQPGALPDLSDGIPCTVDSCDEELDMAIHVPDDDLCDDGQPCNGDETCSVAFDCVGGTTADLDDGVACTVDLCDPETGTITHEPDDGLCGASLCGVATCDPMMGCVVATVNDCCGNGVVEGSEACDDGNATDGDGCDSDCTDTWIPDGPTCPNGGTSILGNPDFETGQLAPWTTQAGGAYMVNQAYEGNWAAETLNNYKVRQDFPAVAVLDLASASFWTWHTPDEAPIQSVDWGYADGTQGHVLLWEEDLVAWAFVDLLPLMDEGKSILWLETWGYSGGGSDIPDYTRFDSYSLCTHPE